MVLKGYRSNLYEFVQNYRTSSKIISILGEFMVRQEIDFLSVGSVRRSSPINVRSASSSDIQKAVDIGESTANNVTQFIKNSVERASRGSSTFFHAKNQRQRPGVQQIGQLAINAAVTGKALANAFG